MKIECIDGNNFLRRVVEADGVTVTKSLYNVACMQSPDLQIIWVWDGKNANKARRDIFPAYKDKGDGVTTPDSFYEFMNNFRTLLDHSNCLQIRVDGFEGDDVIAQIVRLREAGQKIEINSNDQDFRQLVNSDVTLEYMAPKFDGYSADDIRLVKTLVGDSADNIKGLPRFGLKGWDKLTSEQRNLWLQILQDDTVVLGEEDLLDMQDKLGISKGLAVATLNNLELLRTYYTIIGFMEIPMELFASSFQAGDGDTKKGAELLKEMFMLEV
jgi:5'-3' exonuclease